MCTSIALNSNRFYFGRNLDLEYSFGQRVVIAPRNYPFQFRKAGEMKRHYAMIGMATVHDDYPLYAEAANEKGLCAAGLNFPENAFYPAETVEGRTNISPFELIPWLLGRCADLSETRIALENMPWSVSHSARSFRFRPSIGISLTGPAPSYWNLPGRA